MHIYSEYSSSVEVEWETTTTTNEEILQNPYSNLAFYDYQCDKNVSRKTPEWKSRKSLKHKF